MLYIRRFKLGSLIKWICIIGILIVMVVFFAWSFVPGKVSKELSAKTGVPCSVSSIGITPWSITASGIVIGNPPGSRLSKALTVNTTKIKASISRYFQDRVVIDYVGLNNIFLNLEFDKPFSKKGNWTRIMSNLSKNTKGSGKPVLIKTLEITNMDIIMVFRDNPNSPPKRLKGIKRMVLRNVSSTEGLPISAITNQVIGEMLQEVFRREGIQNMLDGIFSPQTFKNLQELFGLEIEIEEPSHA